MDYLDCDGKPYCQERSIHIQPNQEHGKPIESTDFLFISSIILKPHYDAAISYSLKQSNQILIIPNSIDPVSIEGDNNIYLGESTILTVKGGALGTGADWFWYKDQCGANSIGKGETIKVEPTDSTTYFVRAEGNNNTTNCAQIVINVDKRSTSPDGISAETKICSGDNIELTVEGGSLGLGAVWVWYTNECKGQRIGTGKTITVSPKIATTYYVRAEGNLNKTNCTSITIEVFEKSIEPTSIIPIGSTTVCIGNKIKLKVAGGLLANGAEWKWYSGTCYGSPIATGAEVEFTPLSSTNYFVRGEGQCNKTSCASLSITVNDKSFSPGNISKPSEVFKNKKTTLTVNGGSLGKDAQWQWFKNSCGSGKPIGIGTSIIVRTRKPTTYFVNAKGNCNETGCAQTTITPSKKHHWGKTYSSRYKKFLMLGYGIGFERQKISELGIYTSSINGSSTIYDTTQISINGLGVKVEVPFYPFMKDYLSLGFISSYSYGISPSFLTKNNSKTTNTKEKFDYQRFQIESELAFGFKPVKLLFKLKNSIQYNDYIKTQTSNSVSTTQYMFDKNLMEEVLSAGIRLGRYERKTKYKRGNNIDLLYTLSRYHSDDIFAFSFDDYMHLSDWNVGAGFTWWRQSALKFQFEMNFNAKQSEFNFASNNFKSASYLFSLIYNRNWFY